MDQFAIMFPQDAVICAPGDYLVCHQPDTGWQVYRVEDLLLLKRLIALLNNPSALMLEEHMLDSMAPAYFNEVHLLVTAFAPAFTDEQDAEQAIERQTLAEQATGLVRPAREFSTSACRVIRR